MNKQEVAKLLTVASAIDQRTIGEGDVEAWHEILTDALGSDLPFADAREAWKMHYAVSADRLLPVHIINGVREIRRFRKVTAAPFVPPPEAADDPQLYAELYQRYWSDVGNGMIPIREALGDSVD